MQNSKQLLDYAATHPDAIITYHASDMFLDVHSNASYLYALNRVCLLWCIGSQWRQHGCVYWSGVVEEHSSDFLNEIFIGLTQDFWHVFWLRKLGFGSVNRFDVGVGLVLWLTCFFVIEVLEGVVNVGLHWEVNFAFLMIPVHIQSKVTFSLEWIVMQDVELGACGSSRYSSWRDIYFWLKSVEPQTCMTRSILRLLDNNTV